MTGFNEENKAKIYAALHGKLERIRDEVLAGASVFFLQGPSPFRLSQDKYNDFLDSCGILRVTKTGLLLNEVPMPPPHWITESKKPAETENSIIIPSPVNKENTKASKSMFGYRTTKRITKKRKGFPGRSIRIYVPPDTRWHHEKTRLFYKYSVSKDGFDGLCIPEEIALKILTLGLP